MPRLPEYLKVDIEDRLIRHVTANWPALAGIKVRFRGGFAYLDAALPDGDVQPLVRLRYDGDDHAFGFGLYRASHDDYEDSILPTGDWTTSPETAFDTAATLYLTDATEPPTD